MQNFIVYSKLAIKRQEKASILQVSSILNKGIDKILELF